MPELAERYLAESLEYCETHEVQDCLSYNRAYGAYCGTQRRPLGRSRRAPRPTSSAITPSPPRSASRRSPCWRWCARGAATRARTRCSRRPCASPCPPRRYSASAGRGGARRARLVPRRLRAARRTRRRPACRRSAAAAMRGSAVSSPTGAGAPTRHSRSRRTLATPYVAHARRRLAGRGGGLAAARHALRAGAGAGRRPGGGTARCARHPRTAERRPADGDRAPAPARAGGARHTARTARLDPRKPGRAHGT